MPEQGLDAQLRLQQGTFQLDARLQLPSDGISVLLGRSGSGKSILLRAIAGLERAEGFLRVGGQLWQEGAHFRPSHLRPLGYVSQSGELLPHLDVRANLEFGYRRVPRARRRLGLDEVVALFGLETLLGQHAAQLPNSQRQRVAIARALLTSPDLLLLDAPLAGLDRHSRAEILPLLEQLRERLQIPLLYVTDRQDEVTRLADHLVLLDKGQTLASGPPERLLSDPRLPLGHPDETAVVLIGQVESHDPHYQLSSIRVPGGTLRVALSRLPPGAETRVRIFARDVSLSLEPPHNSSILNTLETRIIDLFHEHDSARVMVRLDLGSACILARITRLSADRLELAPERRVYAQIKSVALME
ncbi:molybdenum ABC transporter ATP-binding protein [Azotobacter chroococcum]|uniref:Molybdate transport system ATP-binding protein n=1 Tax=Azotobacter chroococcum TaxID=353 RepID=A0A4R1PIC9_9GAMM|nr:molybdenum ABC transporter ATP-binding protein [Azotobacter chroococcum]TBV98178.1 molybdenum ABC transporter ATP-binding protein [Azotobacter chroococcum]TCL28670.1 molybdate transport system ATP-binding protein [Azotobacter chroococcum]